MEKEIYIEKIKRQNLVFNAVRQVGRLLVKENNRERLIKGICNILVEKQGYYHAWIGLFDNEGKISDIIDSGYDGRFGQMRYQLLQPEKFPVCIDAGKKMSGVFYVQDPVVDCAACFFAEKYPDYMLLATSLSHNTTSYGFMILSTLKLPIVDETEKALIREMGDDIAMGLYRIDLEEKRRRAENEREKSQARFEMLIENSLNHISIIQNNTIVYRSHGLRPEHRLIDKVFNPPTFPNICTEDRDLIRRKYNALATGKISRIETEFQYHPVLNGRRNTELRWALVSACRIEYLGTPAVLTNIMDVTNSKKVQAYLRIQDKMTSLGRVTAGIAHEIRNPLSGIYIFLKALRQISDQMGDVTKVLSIINKIESAANKIESIIQRVMDFSKPSRPKFAMVNLNAYIDEATKLTAVTLKKNQITFEKVLDPHLPECWAEPHLIEQVILNLITNAAEAMKSFDGDKQIYLSTGVSEDNRQIMIRVKDTGPGVPYASQSKIFDPFYTTKANSSGIGLSICHRIILDHGGALKLNPVGEGGAEFIITLPVKHREGDTLDAYHDHD